MAEGLAEQVRQWDRDRYLATLFARDDQRSDLFALYAFDAEIARIPSLVSEPQVGEIRLQWWLDTIDAIFAEQAVDHPIAQALGAAIRKGRLPKEPLRNLVLARTNELYADPMPSLNDLEGYLGETKSAVIQMAAQILLEGKGQGLGTAAGLGGVAQGIAELLTRLPRLPHEGKHLLPSSQDTPALVAHARARLSEARQHFASVPSEAWPAFLPLATTSARLNKLEANGAGHSISALKSQWLIWRAGAKRSIAA
jgi:15-cis-phytoene synthase